MSPNYQQVAELDLSQRGLVPNRLFVPATAWQQGDNLPIFSFQRVDGRPIGDDDWSMLLE
jgi:hypothetical protein